MYKTVGIITIAHLVQICLPRKIHEDCIKSLGFEENPMTDTDSISKEFKSDLYVLDHHLDAAMTPKTYHFAYLTKEPKSLSLSGFFLILALDESESQFLIKD